MEAKLEERIVPDKDIIYCHDYYSDPDVRETAHLIKDGNISAIYKAAKEMATMVSSKDILVPIPSRSGKATTTLLLTKAIARLSRARVANVLIGKNRQALYDLKRTGKKVDDSFFGYSSINSPKRGNIILVDNVYATGATANAAANDFPTAKVLVYARDTTAIPAWKK